MKILIYGVGVQGSLYGARLFEAGHDVTLLARGVRLADLRVQGIILEDRISKRRTVTRVPIVEQLSPCDKYDLALVPVRRDHIGEVLPMLSAARGIRSVLFMHNHAGGSDQLIAAVGRERVLLGFAGASGSRQGDVVRYLLIPQQPTTLGEVEGPPTPCIQEIASTLRECGFNVALSQNMDAWLKTHAVFVTAVCGALYCAGADNYELARSPEIMILFVKGVREGLKSLRALGLPPPPLNLRAIFEWMPRSIAIAYWRRLFGSERGQYYFAEHARVAWAEMKMLSDEVRALPGMGAPAAPSFDLLCGAIDAYAGPMSASTLKLGFASPMGPT
jgi:2-dehydropantoate 2-reductase